MEPETKSRVNLTEEETRIIRHIRKLKQQLVLYSSIIANASIDDFVVYNIPELVALRAIRKKRVSDECEQVLAASTNPPPIYPNVKAPGPSQ